MKTCLCCEAAEYCSAVVQNDPSVDQLVAAEAENVGVWWG